MNLQQTLRTLAVNGYDRFKAEMMKKSPEEIFGSCWKIAGMGEFFDYLDMQVGIDFDNEELSVLVTAGDFLLEALYDCYLSSDYSFDDYEDIRAIVSVFIERKRAEEENQEESEE